MKKFRILACVLFIILCVVLLISCNKQEINKDFTVIALDADGINYLSSQNQKVGYNGNLTLSFELLEGYEILSVNEGELQKEGNIYTILLTSIKRPKTIEITTKKLKVYSITTNSDFCSIDYPVHQLIEDGQIYEHESVYLKAQREDFLCWTKGSTLSNNGEVISYCSDAVYFPEDSIEIFANFLNTAENRYFKYEANGGHFGLGETTSIYNKAYSKYHDRINTYTGLDLKRDGYELVAWNTKADGTGERIGLGSRITVNQTITTLYAEWAQWSSIEDFSFEETENGILITKYLRDNELVVIPSVINSKNVLGVKGHSFKDKHNLSTIVLPNTINFIEDNSFINCSNLNTMIFSDNIMDISDNAFNNTVLTTLYVNAYLAPTNVQNFGYKILDNVDRVLLSDKPNLILQGGSSCAYGFDSAYLSSLMSEEYTVTNFGWNAYRPMAFLIGVVASIVKKGDIYIHAGELDFAAQYCTDNAFQANLWGICEGNYDILAWVDLSNITTIFDSYKEYNQARLLLPQKTYDEFRYYTKEGDNWGENHKDDVVEEIPLDKLPSKWYSIPSGIFSENGFRIMNEYYSAMSLSGAKVYESFGTINKDRVVETEEEIIALENIIRNSLSCPVISHAYDYMFDYKYMDEGNIHHLSYPGAKLRTTMLYNDLIAQLNMEAGL